MLIPRKSNIVRWLIWSIAIVWTLIFSYLLLQPEQQALVNTVVPPAPPSLERELFFTSLHLLSFGFTAWIWCLALYPAPENRRIIIALGLCLLVYGASAELLQLQIPGRTAQWWDMTANVLGIILGIGLWFIGRNLLLMPYQQHILRH